MEKLFTVLLLVISSFVYSQNYQGGMIRTKSGTHDSHIQVAVFENKISINADRYKILRDLGENKYYCINDSTSFTITIGKSIGVGSEVYAQMITVAPEDSPGQIMYYYVNRQVLPKVD